MFANHQPLIAAHAETAHGFADVVTFVICTINRHFSRVGDVVADVDRTTLLTSSQRKGIDYIRQHAPRVLDDIRDSACDRDRLRCLVELPSIGIAKAGFILQLVSGRVGCLDRHNLRVLGLQERTFQRIPASTECLTQRLNLYLEACWQLGTPAELWDGWCTLIAAKYPHDFASAEDVSLRHVLWTRSAVWEEICTPS